MLRLHLAFALLVVPALVACSNNETGAQFPPGDPDPLEGGVLATFRVEGTEPGGEPVNETFRIWTTNEQTIADLYEILSGVNPHRFPAGTFLLGAGVADHNAPWSWHFDPADTEMVEVAMEVCDGRPSYVEQNLADFLNLGLYCPWAARLDAIEDHR